MEQKELLIIGAGPYGLSTAAYAKHRGLDTLLLGEPMGFWRRHMPKGILLRSPTSWHLDPLRIHTFDSYVEELSLQKEEVHPIPVETFLDYSRWFQDQAGLQAQPSFVRELRHADGLFEAELEDGKTVLARNVVMAPGLGYFPNIPEGLVSGLGAGQYSHSCHLVSFDFLKGQRCLIIGGRQSAFEWGALISEQAAAEVHISYRHGTPRLEESDWSWVDPIVRSTAQTRGWFRRPSSADREAIRQRFWSEGRSKLEPWLESRIQRGNIRLWPNSSMVDCVQSEDGRVLAKLDNGVSLSMDHLVLATGYRVNVNDVPCLARDSILRQLRVSEGYPVLDKDSQSNIPGLYFTGPAATSAFGPFFGFVIGCPAAAKIIVERIETDRGGHRA